jgi:predicted transposase/invertase (TIGR01784 family)
VYNEDSHGAVYDAEMQNLNHKPVEWYHLPRRSRYYQGAIDIDYMDKGNSYKRLPESNVMFICTFDPFKKGLSSYTFRECCEECPDLRLGDGTRKVFYNCKYQGDDLPEELQKLYNYIDRGQIGSDLTRRLEQAVDKGRKNALWRTQYMKEWVVIQDAREEGFEEGIEQGIEQGISIRDNEKICDMLRRGKSVEEIVDFCDYPYELVKKIEESLLMDA